jgi:hypothetical protein
MCLYICVCPYMFVGWVIYYFASLFICFFLFFAYFLFVCLFLSVTLFHCPFTFVYMLIYLYSCLFVYTIWLFLYFTCLFIISLSHFSLNVTLYTFYIHSIISRNKNVHIETSEFCLFKKDALILITQRTYNFNRSRGNVVG